LASERIITIEGHFTGQYRAYHPVQCISEPVVACGRPRDPEGAGHDPAAVDEYQKSLETSFTPASGSLDYQKMGIAAFDRFTNPSPTVSEV
jgi:hypothetical protein